MCRSRERSTRRHADCRQTYFVSLVRINEYPKKSYGIEEDGRAQHSQGRHQEHAPEYVLRVGESVNEHDVRKQVQRRQENGQHHAVVDADVAACESTI